MLVPDINYEILRIVHNERIASVIIHSCGNVPPYLPPSLAWYGASVSVLCNHPGPGTSNVTTSSGNSCVIVDRLDHAFSTLTAPNSPQQNRKLGITTGVVESRGLTMTVDWQNATLIVWHRGTSQRYRSADATENEANPKTVFNSIYRDLRWSAAGGGSGEGSTVEVTKKVRKALLTVVRRFKIRSMVDAPCGSFMWMPLVLEKVPDIRYTGVDVACNVVHQLQRKREFHRHRFHCMDMCHQPFLHGADLIFTRDALMHLPYNYTFDFLENVKRSGARYLFVGSYHTDYFNRDIPLGKWYRINLLVSPFNLSRPIASFKEMKDQAMHLFDVSTMTWARPVA
eukprot:EG_transcript_14695